MCTDPGRYIPPVACVSTLRRVLGTRVVRWGGVSGMANCPPAVLCSHPLGYSSAHARQALFRAVLAAGGGFCKS